MDLQQYKYANRVTVYAQSSDNPDRFTVLWRSGVNRQGKVNVHVTASVEDKKAVAEMSAMQYLIEVHEVIGRTPPIKGLLLEFSVPVIRKIAANKSEKYHLYPYAYFLTTRFSEADIGINQIQDWLKPRADKDVLDLVITEPLGELVDIYRFGKVAITKHVIDQFCRRTNHISPAEGYKLIANLVNETELENLSEGATDEEGNKLIAKLFHRRSKWCFVIVENQYGKPAIATAYPKL